MTAVSFDLPALAARVKDDGEFRLAARDWDATVVLEIGDERLRLAVRKGELADLSHADERGNPDLLVSGTAEEWADALAPVPPRWRQDVLFSAANGRGFTVEGDALEVVAPYWNAVRRVIEIMREALHGGGFEPVPDADRKFDTAVGRYVYLRIEGVQYRVYFEEAGSGIPLIMQHTAGADGRQWRHLLEDPDLQAHFRMIAYDLPYHGRSLPPTSVPWWQQQYRLTGDFLRETVLTFCRALDLERPAYIGCSVGGHLAADLAYYHPDDFRAVIGVNAGIYTPTTNKRQDTWYHPRVSNEWVATQMLGPMSPLSPEPYRRETGWVYSQGAPGVFSGDTYYYGHDHNLTGKAQDIDTSKVAVYLLTGEYDRLAEEDGTPELARQVAGAKYTVIPGIGHFGPSENPELLKRYLLPVLEEIRAGSS